MEKLLSTAEAADLIGVKESTLRAWRVQGIGPRYARIGHNKVKYSPRDLEAWWRIQLRLTNGPQR